MSVLFLVWLHNKKIVNLQNKYWLSFYLIFKCGSTCSMIFRKGKKTMQGQTAFPDNSEGGRSKLFWWKNVHVVESRQYNFHDGLHTRRTRPVASPPSNLSLLINHLKSYEIAGLYRGVSFLRNYDISLGEEWNTKLVGFVNWDKKSIYHHRITIRWRLLLLAVANQYQYENLRRFIYPLQD